MLLQQTHTPEKQMLGTGLQGCNCAQTVTAWQSMSKTQVGVYRVGGRVVHVLLGLAAL